jgi:hypothetical protein
LTSRNEGDPPPGDDDPPAGGDEPTLTARNPSTPKSDDPPADDPPTGDGDGGGDDEQKDPPINPTDVHEDGTPDVTSVPEPMSLVLLGTGISGFVLRRVAQRRRRLEGSERS